MLARLASGLLLRKLVGELQAIGVALGEQNRLLTRLVDHVAPDPPKVERQTLRDEGSLSYLDAIEAGLAIDYIERTARDTGHVPDEDEVLIYLADEKTTDLHKRLVEREAELTRLAESRR